MQAGQLVAAVGEVASLLVWLQRQSGGKDLLESKELIDGNTEGKEGCAACGWSKEEKENLEVALHRTQEQVWIRLQCERSIKIWKQVR